MISQNRDNATTHSIFRLLFHRYAYCLRVLKHCAFNALLAFRSVNHIISTDRISVGVFMHAKFKEHLSTDSKSTSIGFCQHCCSQLAQPRSKLLICTQDALFLLAEITKTFFEYFLSLMYAVFVILAAICPRAIGYDARYSRRNDEHDRMLAAAHNQEAADLNSMTEYVSRLEDCQRVDEINFAVKQVENGIGNPIRIKEMRNDLYQFRAFEHSRMQQIKELEDLIQYQERQLRYLTQKADKEKESGHIYEAEKLRNWAKESQCDIEILHRKLKSI